MKTLNITDGLDLLVHDESKSYNCVVTLSDGKIMCSVGIEWNECQILVDKLVKLGMVKLDFPNRLLVSLSIMIWNIGTFEGNEEDELYIETYHHDFTTDEPIGMEYDCDGTMKYSEFLNS